MDSQHDIRGGSGSEQLLRLNGRKAWTIVTLLFLAQMINYFDKSVIGLAAVPIMHELQLDSEQYGLVASAFFSLYAVSGVLVGLFLAHRIAAKALLAVLVLIWSLSALPIVFFSSLATLIACRVILGIGEGPANATSMSACHEWFTPDRRNMPSALLTLGASVGSLLAGPILSYAIIGYGWRAGFVMCSALGFVWLILWLLLGENGPDSLASRVRSSLSVQPDAPGADLPQRILWGDRTIIGSLITGFCAYWVVGFTIAWLAPMMQTGLGYDQVTTGWVVSIIAGINSLILLAVSYLSQRMILNGRSSRSARGVVNGVCMLGGAAALTGAALVADPLAKIALIAIGGALPTLTFTLGPSLISGIVPLFHRSRMIITIYAGITIAGFLSPWMAGRVIGDRGLAGFDDALLINAVVVVAGGIAALILLRPEQSALRFSAAYGDGAGRARKSGAAPHRV